MDSNDHNHEEGTYTLSQLLGEEITLVIPDIQRDYCWGQEDSGIDAEHDRVSVFIKGLTYLYLTGQPCTLGLLYGYEEPVGSQRLSIIDGQQRLTTLYLLIGMLYRRTPTDSLRQLLISDYQLIDERQPRLVYQMRREAMYFLSDLVTYFFLDRNGRLSLMEKSVWYHSVYASDPTIQSFIRAIRQIDKALEEAKEQAGWSFEGFADYIVHKATLIYHDLGSRRAAEDMYITINTTGEPLTYPQQMRILMLNQSADQSADARWEEMEQWAWQHRDQSDPEKPQTSDQALERYLHLWQAYCSLDRGRVHKANDIDEIYQGFCAYRTLVECQPEALSCDATVAGDAFRILATIAFIRKWRYSDALTTKTRTHISDIWHWLNNILRYTKVNRTDTEQAITMMYRMESPDIISLLTVRGDTSRLVNNDERSTLTMQAHSANNRTHVATVIEAARTLPLLNGRIGTLIRWCTDRNGQTDIKRMARYIDMIKAVWGDDINCKSELDDVRRVLLCLRSDPYPMPRRGQGCLSLCWHAYDWQRLMQNAPEMIKCLLDRLIQSEMPVRDKLRQICDRFNDRTYPYYFLIKSPKLLSQCENRMLIRPNQVFLGYYMEEKQDGVNATKMRWWVEQQPLKPTNQWATIRAYGARCLYTDNKKQAATIDLYYTPESESRYRIEIFNRNASDTRDISEAVKALIADCTGDIHYDNKRYRYYLNVPDARTATETTNRLLQRHL